MIWTGCLDQPLRRNVDASNLSSLGEEFIISTAAEDNLTHFVSDVPVEALIALRPLPR